MGDVKRWSVTYTKHIKQKRKVYQDGILELHTSSHKIMLYDDCEKLLDSRFVKKDEAVRCGEALAFDAYLVDVGDPEGDQKPIPNLNIQGRDKKITEKSVPLNGQKFRNNSTSVGDRKTNSGKNKAPIKNLSPSQKIIREFKRTELNKYGAQPYPDSTKASATEWQVLYTTQIIQKAKKYHDGILKVASCGSQGRQVTLYDANRRLLDSRFLKKDEVIGSGESLAFDCHLVDIGVPEGDHKSPMDLNVQGRSCNAVGETALLHGQQAQHSSFVECGISELSNSGSPPNSRKAPKAAVREWHALFTTQITQKAKKYHSGILRLAFCGSYRMQATLLNEDGTILSSKYLKLSEDVRTGSAFELPKYLVEVGEPRTSPEGETHNNAYSGKEVDSNHSSFDVDNIKLSRRMAVNKPLRDGETRNNAYSGKEVDSNHSRFDVDNIILSRRMAVNKPLRDAHGILSILRKPLTQENQVQGQPMQDSNSKRGEEDNHVEETTQRHDYNAEMLKFKAVHDDHSLKVSKLAYSENKGELHPKDFTSSRFSLGSETSDTLRPKFYAECIGRSFTRPVSSNEDSTVLDALESDFPDDTQHPTAPVPHDETNENVETGDSMSSKAISSLCDGQFFKEVKIENSPQRNAGCMEIGTRCCEGAFACDIVCSSGCTPLGPGAVERKSFEEDKNINKMEECPSFDLGF